MQLPNFAAFISLIRNIFPNISATLAFECVVVHLIDASVHAQFPSVDNAYRILYNGMIIAIILLLKLKKLDTAL
jgi:hypothetical protein